MSVWTQLEYVDGKHNSMQIAKSDDKKILDIGRHFGRLDDGFSDKPAT